MPEDKHKYLGWNCDCVIGNVVIKAYSILVLHYFLAAEQNASATEIKQFLFSISFTFLRKIATDYRLKYNEEQCGAFSESKTWTLYTLAI